MLDLGDHAGNLFGSLSGALGQLAHLVRHHREAAALLAGARSLDRRVQSQEIGLIGDVLDHLHDAGNHLGLIHQLVDGAGGQLH